MSHLKTIAWITLALLLTAGVFARAGMTRRWIEGIGVETERQELRVWDWWSASTNEEYGAYYAEIEKTFEAQHPDIDIVYQIVPFGNYVQKLSTAMVGDTPPDVFQSSVYWAEGFYQRGMLRPLDDLLAEPSKDDSSALRMPLDFSTGIIEELFVPSVHPLLSLDPADWGDLHISTVYALGHIEWGDPGSVIRLHIYTDGSCKYLPDDFKSAWAIVVVGELPSGDFCLLGVLGGPTVTDSGSSAYIGADAQSAADSEASAIVAALRFACQHYCTSAKLYYDALI
ncbi:MAG: extracellular solute-binding protein, partial [Candidatus Latescibacteria bacterium]|nr:extracellular solute-binding protein [Candidatus Latescibacterota bacterium]